jgi:hypothetical protein
MPLPGNDALRDRVPSDLTPIEPRELTDVPQAVRFDGMSVRSCTADGDCSKVCGDDDPNPECRPRFTLNEHVFIPNDPPRVLKLGQASEWTITGDGAFTHPFHIHVNPFEVEREEPGPDGKMRRAKVWKDTISLRGSGDLRPIIIRSRYRTFEGDFVIHCHILGHEDMGMMQRVRVSQ